VAINGQQSARREVTSGVPQGSVLGPTLFTIFINDIKSDILRFADDAKLIGRVGSEDEVGRLKMNLASLDGWAEK